MKAELRSKAGLTVIELLVVIGIGATLAAIITAALCKGRHKARTAECQSNLRQIGMALQLYTADFSGLLPHEDELSPPDSCWYYLIDPYLDVQEDGELQKVKVCPAVNPESEARAESYRMNSMLEHGGAPFRDIASFARPSVTVGIFDGEVGGLRVKHKGKDEDFSKRHHGGGNILFLDWHVKWSPKKFVRADVKQKEGGGRIIWDAFPEEGRRDAP